MLRRVFHYLKNFPFELGAFVFLGRKSLDVVASFPYICQFASRDLVASFREKRSSTSTDPLWEKSGADSLQDYVLRSWSLCGMACLSMILLDRGIHPGGGLVLLGKEAMAHGVYRYEGCDHAVISALHYGPFLRYISLAYGLSGKFFAYASKTLLAAYVVRGFSVIVSVDPAIRFAVDDYSSPSPTDGGHLVLITGCSLEDGRLQRVSLHNPSGCSYNSSQESVSYDPDTFCSYWSGRMIVVF